MKRKDYEPIWYPAQMSPWPWVVGFCVGVLAVLLIAGCGGFPAKRVNAVCVNHGGIYNVAFHNHNEEEGESALVKCRDGYAQEVE